MVGCLRTVFESVVVMSQPSGLKKLRTNVLFIQKKFNEMLARETIAAAEDTTKTEEATAAAEDATKTEEAIAEDATETEEAIVETETAIVETETVIAAAEDATKTEEAIAIVEDATETEESRNTVLMEGGILQINKKHFFATKCTVHDWWVDEWEDDEHVYQMDYRSDVEAALYAGNLEHEYIDLNEMHGTGTEIAMRHRMFEIKYTGIQMEKIQRSMSHLERLQIDIVAHNKLVSFSARVYDILQDVEKWSSSSSSSSSSWYIVPKLFLSKIEEMVDRVAKKHNQQVTTAWFESVNDKIFLYQMYTMRLTRQLAMLRKKLCYDIFQTNQRLQLF